MATDVRNGVYHLPTGRGITTCDVSMEEGSDVSSTDSEAELAAADHHLNELDRHCLAELRNMKEAIITNALYRIDSYSGEVNPLDDCERRALAELRKRWEAIMWEAIMRGASRG